MEIECGTRWIPYICNRIEYIATPVAQSIVCRKGNDFVAGSVFDMYNGATVSAHILISGTPSREWFACIFDYPFNVLGVKKIVGQVRSSNTRALKLDKGMGFVEEALIKDFYPNDDLVVLTMTREQCKVLNSPKWARAADKVRSSNGR